MPTFILVAVLCIVAALSSGCQQATSAPPANTANTANAANGTTKAEEPKPADPRNGEPAESKETETPGSLATPTDAYKTAYELRKKKDIEGLKKVMSKDIKDFLTMMGEAEKKSLDDMLREMVEKPQAETAEARNEKIKGDRATVEYLSETGAWKTMDLEKEGGKWLLTFPKADKPVGPEPER